MNVQVHQLTKSYPQQKVFENLSFDLQEEEILCVLGPSGSGKSTLLRCLCGLEKWDSGKIVFNGKEVDSIDAEKMNISVVFDEPRLIRHLTVYENIALGCQYRGLSKEILDQRVKDIAKQTELTDFLNRKPACLSAGQKQRVALARALVRECDLLLLDEALNNLDEPLRKKMLDLLFRLKDLYHFSCIYVTHSQLEAKMINGRGLFFHNGKWAVFSECSKYLEKID